MSEQVLNVGRAHWLVCHKHRARWFVGANLFSAWKRERQEAWVQNDRILRSYHDVQPVNETETHFGECPECHPDGLYVFVGKLFVDPELRYSGGNLPTTHFSLLVCRDDGPISEQFNVYHLSVRCSGELASEVFKIFRKGNRVRVQGRFQFRRFEIKPLTDPFVVDLVAEHVELACPEEQQDAAAVDYAVLPPSPEEPS